MALSKDMRAAGLTGLAALGGAALAALLGIPAGALIGAMLAVAALGAAGHAVGLPVIARDLAFLVIGISLGAGIDAQVVPHLPGWSVSLLGLAVALVATLGASSLLLNRIFGIDWQTAVLASSPGTMSNAVAIAIEGKGDAAAVTILQLMRLVILVTLVPPVAAVLGAPDGGAAADRAVMALPALVLLLAIGLPLGRLAGRRGISAACLLTGILLSGIAHGAGLLHGAAPAWMIFLGFTVTGAVLGTRISKVDLRAALRLAGAGVVVVGMALGMALVFAVITRALTGFPLGQILIAYAPGGVEAMAAIGLALGYDPAFVAAHHFARILILLALVPLFLRRAR
ncbi:AbrB family transcriptional regulator [Paracoccus sp. 1_MG-2023]|uniref:AbrB family transcriptional regulator n=1 Tax=unclassified Paracoccus (in: a-proteobacteria) TaxID=2688777 RepID=UPI001C0A1446|nr:MULTISPECIES: AbrB family transcriptional regulator [unclassified Paracoccus (in: a-proteobacteria)]MBU2957989.1 AbrB family transcriptional regulator [Paracoccus sp. C2R09]MDO6668817.1 AbrB family transcriptional regulator [Paracoccus sp. 1_MG-2023]